jgi:hypothetical protein
MSKPTAQELRELLPNVSDDVIHVNCGDVVIAKMPSPIARTQKQSVKRQGKYNATPTTYNGVVYHSKKEAQFAQTLDLQLRNGEIDYILRQVPFDLGAGIVYRADFVTITKYTQEYHWNVVVYEVKGMETPAWKLKHKLFKDRYPLIQLEVV